MRIFSIIFALILSVNTAFAYNYPDNVKSALDIKHKVYYAPETKQWARIPLKNSIAFTKYMTVGTGSFSEFLYQKKYYDTNTTLEFFDGNKLIGYNQHQLKFYELGFEGKNITKKELKASEVHELFPDVEIVKISQFKNNKITLKKPFKKNRTFLILNDTNRYFYKYSYENYGNGTELIKSIIDTDKPQKIVFSHFGSNDKNFPKLTIIIKNSLFKK